MAKGISTTDPSPGQFLQKNRKKRSWGKGIIWNPRQESLDVQKIADIEKDSKDYMSCSLPSAPNCVGIYLDSKTESQAFVANSLADDKDKVFIGRLNLQRLGFFDQLSRLCGNLGTLYIVKHSIAEIPNSENDEDARDNS